LGKAREKFETRLEQNYDLMGILQDENLQFTYETKYASLDTTNIEMSFLTYKYIYLIRDEWVCPKKVQKCTMVFILIFS